jgi:hypothetical protein
MTIKLCKKVVPQRRWQYQYILYVIFCFCSVNAFAQAGPIETDEDHVDERRPAYLNIAVGLNISSFRDFATSPLVYSGYPMYTALSHVDRDEKRESHFTLSYSFGKYRSDFNQHSAESKVYTLSFNHLELFQILPMINSKLNVKIGGQFNATGNYRENVELFNNSEGVDIIATLFGSAKVTWNISRIERGGKKRGQTLSYTMNGGIVNSSFRNGFAYTSPSAPLNDDEFFADYELRLFQGFRLNSTLDYTIFIHNKNAIQLSYLWDTYRTGGHHDNFEMTTHILQVSLLFGL